MISLPKTYWKIPEKEDDFLPSACLLLEKRRELATVEQALAAKKEEFQMKMEELQDRREELERKEGQLKQAILKFDKFLKESNWICIQNTAASKTLELGQIKLAALNLFQMVAKHRKLSTDVPPDDTEAQLDLVQLCIGDLIDILANFRKSEPTPVSQPEPMTESQSELESR
ncbi:hypothetical protein JD844_014961 [Phrynosoma platyrhinos]|uniref:DUF4200 domain-containing protein n=1 Tax=Phrynosoma platyrhinos TaxID=52577 RepID=A0ABQ7T7D8_PHRPL|nr:hypothetical protein JD844_014961 [Phrynosoma platyrhinos]